MPYLLPSNIWFNTIYLFIITIYYGSVYTIFYITITKIITIFYELPKW